MMTETEYYPIQLKCPYCRRWFKVKGDLNSAVSNINRHIGKIHPDEPKIVIGWVTKDLLAYIRTSRK